MSACQSSAEGSTPSWDRKFLSNERMYTPYDLHAEEYTDTVGLGTSFFQREAKILVGLIVPKRPYLKMALIHLKSAGRSVPYNYPLNKGRLLRVNRCVSIELPGGPLSVVSPIAVKSHPTPTPFASNRDPIKSGRSG